MRFLSALHTPPHEPAAVPVALDSWLLEADRRSGTHVLLSAGSGHAFALPADPKLAARSLAFFLPLRRRIPLALEAFRGHSRVRLAESTVISRLREHVGEDVETAVSAGTPGPYNKQAVLLLGRDGRPRAIAKVGLTPAAIGLLRQELAWLERLASRSELACRVPAVLAAVDTPGAFAILQLPERGRRGPGRPGLDHLRFIRALQAAGPRQAGYGQSTMRRSMLARAARVPLSRAWQVRAELALDRIDRALANADIPGVSAHRDFAPWNTLETGRGLFVFDWEYASDGYLPLYDLCHFLLLPVAQRRPVTAADARAVIRRLSSFAAAETRSTEAASAVQLLAYLVDLALFYLESNQGADAHDRIVQRYGALIDAFADWSRNL